MRKKKKSNQGIIVLFVIGIACMALYFLIPKPPLTLDMMEKRAVWVSYLDLDDLDYSSITSFEKGFENICINTVNNQCNTLIVHVRAFQDALYKTNKFPISKVITGRELTYDPLDIMIEIAHQYHLKFEAWINPYRISHNQATFNQFINNSPIKDWINTEHVINYGEYNYILNPGSERARDYIVDGVREIVENYNVDGIHFDDYFYVEGTYQGVSEKQRKENVNILIKDVYKTIKDMNSNIVFGISPQGNYENCLLAGADVDTWLSNDGYIDYIMPQIYWTNEYYRDGKIKMFNKRVSAWKRIDRNKDVDLYVGLALYQSGKELSHDKGWSMSNDNIVEQIEILYDYDINGYCLFSYNSMLGNGKKEMDNLLSKYIIY